MELTKLKTLFDKAYESGQTNREKAADDIYFYWITQWDDELMKNCPLQYRGQFDVLRKAGRKILSDLFSNPVQPDFKPKDQSRNDDAEVLDGMYRADDRSLATQEAYNYASQESVVCGFGAWEIFTEYESNAVGDKNQSIKRDWLPEANNTVFWDPNAKKLDKSDSEYVCILKAYTKDGYEKLCEELGDGDDCEVSNFATPEGYGLSGFRWVDSGNKYYVATIYVRKKVNDVVLTLQSPYGEEIRLRKGDIKDVLDELVEEGYSITDEKKIKRWAVTKYICSGEKILNGGGKGERIAGEHIPVVPVYGERAIVDGCEVYEGVTRLAKDPQRLRNFMLSYLNDIVTRSPRPKPIFYPEQVAGLENMYEENGADNNFPYYLTNRLAPDGTALPVGPVAQMPEQTVPTALLQMIDLSRQSIEDVANPGVPQDIADPDLSGKAVALLQNAIDQQSFIYQHNLKYAKRRDAEIYASIATQIHDTPKMVTIETEDGNRKEVQLMNVVIDRETGNPVVLNDITNMEFEVYADIGLSYKNEKEQTRERLMAIMETLPEGDPLKNMMRLTLLEDMDGATVGHIRDFARKQLILGGFKEPETEEEMQMVQQAQQSQKQDPNEMIGQAELMKAQAAMMKEQREAQRDQIDAADNAAQTQIQAFDAETKRISAMVKAEQTQADIENSKINTFNKHIETQTKVQDSLVNRLRGSLTQAQRSNASPTGGSSQATR